MQTDIVMILIYIINYASILQQSIEIVHKVTF
jgi:hypothetical protein